MKRLIMVSYGHLDSQSRLFGATANEYESLLEVLRQYTTDGSVGVFTSTSSGAKDHAVILSQAFNVECKAHEVLDTRGSKFFTKKIEERFLYLPDIVIALTHRGFISEYLQNFTIKKLNVEFPKDLAGKCRACVIDSTHKIYRSITLIF